MKICHCQTQICAGGIKKKRKKKNQKKKKSDESIRHRVLIIRFVSISYMGMRLGGAGGWSSLGKC